MLRLRCSRNAATSSSRRMLRRVGWARRLLSSSVKAISELGSFEELLLSHDRTTQVLKVELNREHRLNALSEKMGREILSLCEALKNAGPDSGIRYVCGVSSPQKQSIESAYAFSFDHFDPTLFVLVFEKYCLSFGTKLQQYKITRCLVITGAGRSFSTGRDLKVSCEAFCMFVHCNENT